MTAAVAERTWEVFGVDTVSPVAVADYLGVRCPTVVAWTRRLGYPPVGSGYRFRLTRTDVLICRAWQAITGAVSSHNTAARHLCTHAATAIRRRPARWLLVTPTSGQTFDTIEQAGRSWLAERTSAAFVIDLHSREVAT